METEFRSDRAFHPTPMHVHIGREEIEIHSLDDAMELIRSLRNDRLGTYAEMLLTQMESARLPAQEREAWKAFETWTDACHLRCGERHWSRAA